MKRFLVIILMSILSLAVSGQGLKDVRINEFMVFNQTNYEDDYGNRIGWIELFNTGHTKVNIAGCYLSVKLGDQSKTYRIPPHDSRTIIEPQGYVVFFCDGVDTKGTFHTNFTLDQTGYIAFLDASSKGDPISEVNYDVAAQRPDVSMGWENKDGKLVFDYLTRTTPMATNDISDPIPQHELFRQKDPHGYLMAITAMAVVFSALTLLYLLFALVGKVISGISGKRKEISDRKKGELLASNAQSFTGEAEIVAIAMALHQFQSELHDKQATVLTINRVARAYSPWSSKIYGLRQTPVKK